MIRPYEYAASPTQATGIYPSPYARAEYDEAGNPILDTRERNYFDQRFAELQPYSAKTGTVNPNTVPVTMAANGGLMFDNPSGMDEDRNLMRGNLQKGLFGLGYAEGGKVKHMLGGGLTAMISKMVKDNPNVLTQYEYDKINQRYNTVNQPQQSTNDFIQMFGGPMGARESGLPAYQFDPEAREYRALAAGGHLGDYSDGGRLLKGPGDGVSDNIPAVIGSRQPARLADGEFVIPARIVSEIGNGSTDAGAKRLYAMMDKIQAGRKKTVGKGKVDVDSKAKKHLLA
jgi:hypothetical protein